MCAWSPAASALCWKEGWSKLGSPASSRRRYRRAATALLPWLIQHQLPIEVIFETTLEKGGQYHRCCPPHIALYTSAFDFLPDGRAYEPLRALTRYFAGDELDFELELVLKKEEAPPCKLGEEGSGATQLGWLTWACSVPLQQDAEGAVLRL